MNYIAINKRAPDHILMFRDGVSEGEYETVKQGEGVEIQKAIERIWKDVPPNYAHGKPKLTFIVVGKRCERCCAPFAYVSTKRNSGTAFDSSHSRPCMRLAVIHPLPDATSSSPLRGKIPGGGNLAPGVLVDQQLESPYAKDWYVTFLQYETATLNSVR
jgi:hypothetical protein